MFVKKERTGNATQPLVIHEKAWDQLVSVQYIDRSLLRREIAQSWERCLSNNLNPITSKNACLEKDYLKIDTKRYLLEVALPHMRQLFSFVKGKDYIVMLSAADGTLLSVFGDRKMYSVGESLNLVAGGSCLENVVGTNSPGICLVQKLPVQVFSREHYCRLYHDWCCSAAPILDSQGGLIGTLDLSNRNEKLHPADVLDLVKLSANTIQSEYNYRVLHDDFKKSYYYFNMIVNTLPEALIFFDRNDDISYLNKNAVKLLGGNSEQFVGKHVDDVFPNFSKIKQRMNTGQHWSRLQLKTSSGLMHIEACMTPINNEFMESYGIVCTLKEERKTKPRQNIAQYTFDDFVYLSRKMKACLLNAKKIAATDINVLIQGESGTGKEILAQAIHNGSSRRGKPFLAINCAALPKELIQSELFGYEDGSFTGARKGGKAGKFELCHEGTIFLDEIGDMPLDAQANLLRVVQEGCVVRIGGANPIPLDVRVIAATNKNLLQEIKTGNFRLDLFYRLAIMNVTIPPLRERKEDVWCLVEHFAKKHLPTLEGIRFSPQVKTIFDTYDWPGNVRELENVALNFLNKMSGKTVTIDDLPDFVHASEAGVADDCCLKKLEWESILSVMAKCQNNVSHAAKVLGISRATLYRKLQRMNAKQSQSPGRDGGAEQF